MDNLLFTISKQWVDDSVGELTFQKYSLCVIKIHHPTLGVRAIQKKKEMGHLTSAATQ